MPGLRCRSIAHNQLVPVTFLSIPILPKGRMQPLAAFGVPGVLPDTCTIGDETVSFPFACPAAATSTFPSDVRPGRPAVPLGFTWHHLAHEHPFARHSQASPSAGLRIALPHHTGSPAGKQDIPDHCPGAILGSKGAAIGVPFVTSAEC